MELIFEKSRSGRRTSMLPDLDVPAMQLTAGQQRELPLRLPEIAEVDITRHYSALERRSFGINNGAYLLGSCTMKYNPPLHEEIAKLPGFAALHPLQPVSTVQGALEVLVQAEELLSEITGMDAFTFQPAAGAHGELTGLCLIRAFHEARGDNGRNRMLVPEAAHGTNPASAAMANFDVVTLPSSDKGGIDLGALRAVVGPDTAGLMLTNPNTEGVFDENIVEITRIVHEAGGLCYYDGANLNAIMGITRPGDMGFDVIHLNLHKTFSTPHGGGGPGAGAVGVKEILIPYLPVDHAVRHSDGTFGFETAAGSIGSMKAFYGNFLVVVRALAYILTLGRAGIREASQNAVLNAYYLMKQLDDLYPMAHDGICVHEFVMSLANLKKTTGIGALDLAKGMLDFGMHPPTMYFPLTVAEALMVEPTETESRETLDAVAAAFRTLYQRAHENPQSLTEAPKSTPVRRPDEAKAAREPRLRYVFETKA